MASTSLFSPPWTPLTSISAVHVMTWVTRYCPAPEGQSLCSQPQAYPPPWFPPPVLRLLVALVSSFIPTNSSPRTDFHWSPNNRSELCSPFTPRNQNASHPHRARGVATRGHSCSQACWVRSRKGKNQTWHPANSRCPFSRALGAPQPPCGSFPLGTVAHSESLLPQVPCSLVNSLLQSVFSRGTDLYRAYPRCCGRCKMLGFS